MAYSFSGDIGNVQTLSRKEEPMQDQAKQIDVENGASGPTSSGPPVVQDKEKNAIVASLRVCSNVFGMMIGVGLDWKKGGAWFQGTNDPQDLAKYFWPACFLVMGYGLWGILSKLPSWSVTTGLR
jgi:hypothetical protein